MIIDLSYIRNVLEVDVEDSKLQYLLHHYFDDICQKINVATTLSEQDISDIAMASTDEAPMLGYNETSLFQDTIIYGIACHLNNTGVTTKDVPQVIYNEYITKMDISTLSLKEDGTYEITYCVLYNHCLKELNDYLNDESQVGYVRRLLNLNPTIVVDKEIEFLIDHYTKYITELMPDVDTESTDLAFDKEGNTWCDLADAAMADLKKTTFKNYGVKVFDRRGARTKYGAWGPQ